MDGTRDTRSDRGQVLALFAISLVAIVAMTGLVIDGGMTFVQRRDQQNTTDAAAMAGAYAYVNGGTESTAAAAAATANGVTAGVDGAVVTVSTAAGAGGGQNVTVTITKPHHNYFAGIMGFSTWDVSTTATAFGGFPNGAVGAMPILFNKKAFPHGVGPSREMVFDEPGSGSEDVPQTPGQFNWTVYCTAHGNPCNGDSRTVDDLINDRGSSTVVDLNDMIGPLNAGAHATLFDSLAAYVGGDFPVSIVNDDGEMQGWAMLHLTGSVGGSTKQIRGYFVSPVNVGSLVVVQGVGRGGNYGDTAVRLVN